MKHKLTAAGFIAVAGLIGKLEGRELVAYYDIGGVLTICDGIVVPGLKEGASFSYERCDELTYMKIREHVAIIDKYVAVDLPQPTLEAMILLVHNIGETQFRTSTAVKRMNAGNIAGGCVALTWFNKVKGKVIQGLINRRAFERNLCMKGVK